MLIVYRIFWIVGLIALVAEMVILANPRQVAPQKASDWEIREHGRFRVRAPKRFRVERNPWQAWQLSAIGDEVRFLDIVTLSRGKRTGMQIVIAAGGVMGYVAAQSMVSLVNGLIATVLLLVGLAISFNNPPAGFGLSAVVAVALGVFFAYRFFTTGKWMPGGVTMILSAIAFVLMALAALRTRE
jgi:uncharacterized membrane protein (UPF0136 family)